MRRKETGKMRKLTDLHPMFSPDEGAVDYDALPDDHMVPVSALKSMRTDLQGKLSAKEQEAAAKDDELLLYKTTVRNLQSNSGPAITHQQEQTADPIVAFFKDRDPDEPVTVAEVTQISRQMTANNVEQARLARVMAQPDFQDIIYKHLPLLLQADPGLSEDLRSISSVSARFAAAYRLGKTEPGYIAKTLTDKTATHEDAGKAKENETKPRSTATVGASGAANSSDADKIRAAKPGTPEFRKMQKEFAARRRE